MKSNSNEFPKTIIELGNGEYQFAYSVEECVNAERTSFNYDVVIVRDATYASIVSAIIREKYSFDEREAAIRKGIANPLDKDYVDFNNFVEQTKTLVKELLNNGVG